MLGCNDYISLISYTSLDSYIIIISQDQVGITPSPQIIPWHFFEDFVDNKSSTRSAEETFCKINNKTSSKKVKKPPNSCVRIKIQFLFFIKEKPPKNVPKKVRISKIFVKLIIKIPGSTFFKIFVDNKTPSKNPRIFDTKGGG